MTDSASPEHSGPQLRFFAAGLDLLADEGYGALKLAALCRRVGVTTGSFYHSFASWQAFTSGLLEYWHRERTTRFAELAEAEVDPVARVDLLVRAAVSLPHGAESAIRVWAGVDPAVGALQEQVDTERLAAVQEAMAGVMGDDDAARAEASHLAHAAFFLLVGFEQSHAAGDAAALEWALRMIQRRALGESIDDVRP